MDIELMKEATILFFKMIEQHPEICPHRYEWKYSEAPKDGKKIAHYKCRYCSASYTIERDENDRRPY